MLLLGKKGKSAHNSGDEASTYDDGYDDDNLEYDDFFYTEKIDEPTIAISAAGQTVRWGAFLAAMGILLFAAYVAIAAIIRKVSRTG